MMPIKDKLRFVDSCESPDDNINDVAEAPKTKIWGDEKVRKCVTYFFPSGRCAGFRFTVLSAAKTSSHTAASYEFGPRKQTGTRNFSKTFIV